MYRIGICDDEKGTCEELEKMTRHFFDIQREKTEIEIFYSGNIFMDYLDQGNWFHLLFLDIELTSSNGIEIGNYIRTGRNCVYILQNTLCHGSFPMQTFRFSCKAT